MSPRDNATATKVNLVLRELQSLLFDACPEVKQRLCMSLGFKNPGSLVEALSTAEKNVERSTEIEQERLQLEERGVELSLKFLVTMSQPKGRA